MMGIYIKNIEMPKDCRECPVKMYSTETGETWCLSAEELLADGYRSIQFYKRPEWCSLVELKEPHGDLIDRDILEQELKNGIKAGNLEEGYEHYANINSTDDCVECVRYADTVIEAEDKR